MIPHVHRNINCWNACSSFVIALLVLSQNCALASACPHAGCQEAKLLHLHLKTCAVGNGVASCPTNYHGCEQARKLLAHYRRCRMLRSRQAGQLSASSRREPVQQHCLVCSLVARQARSMLEHRPTAPKATAVPAVSVTASATSTLRKPSYRDKKSSITSFMLNDTKALLVAPRKCVETKMPPPPPRRLLGQPALREELGMYESGAASPATTISPAGGRKDAVVRFRMNTPTFPPLSSVGPPSKLPSRFVSMPPPPPPSPTNQDDEGPMPMEVTVNIDLVDVSSAFSPGRRPRSVSFADNAVLSSTTGDVPSISTLSIEKHRLVCRRRSLSLGDHPTALPHTNQECETIEEEECSSTGSKESVDLDFKVDLSSSISGRD